MAYLELKRNGTRGCRNNNPLNIRKGTSHWLGKVPNSKDKQFEAFLTMDYGIRAAAKLLQRYMEQYRLRSVEAIVARWAPASDNNNVARYVDYVSARLVLYQIDPNKLKPSRLHLSALICAMAKIESDLTLYLDDVSKVLSHFKIG